MNDVELEDVARLAKANREAVVDLLSHASQLLEVARTFYPMKGLNVEVIQGPHWLTEAVDQIALCLHELRTDGVGAFDTEDVPSDGFDMLPHIDDQPF